MTRQERNALATAEQEAEKKRYADHFPGWTKSKARACRRRLAGLPCSKGSHSFLAKGCDCFRGPAHTRIMEHARMWFDEDGNRALTAEPYRTRFEQSDIDQFQAECEALGLTVDIDDNSPYCPGQAVLFVVRRSLDQ